MGDIMRKTAFFFIAFFVLSFLPINTLYAASNGYPTMEINVNGQRIHLDTPAIVLNNRTMVPVRGVFEKMGADVEWYTGTTKIVVTLGNTQVVLNMGKTSATVNGEIKYMDVPPVVINNRTLIPLRFISESIGMWVGWVQGVALATITHPDYFNNLPSNRVLGYTTNDYLGDNSSYQSFTTNASNISEIATFSYSIDNYGNLKKIGESQSDAVNYANSNNVKPLLLINNFNNGGFDIDLVHSVLSSSSRRAALIQNILVALSREKYSGVNIDFEHIYWYDRSNYSAFVRELNQKLKPYGYLTTLSVPAKDTDYYANNNWNGAIDYKEIAKYADYLMIMTYDEHWFGGDPGPVASYPWVENVIKYAVTQMPSKKILLGIGAYGYDWAYTGSRAIAVKNINSLAVDTGTVPQWDSIQMSKYFNYVKNGTQHQVWYEDTDGILPKLDLVSRYGLGGIGIWKLGYENSDFWTLINSKFPN